APSPRKATKRCYPTRSDLVADRSPEDRVVDLQEPGVPAGAVWTVPEALEGEANGDVLAAVELVMSGSWGTFEVGRVPPAWL
ncbi:MAG: hypothetical protein ACR2OH_04950, partial [Microthrixaceae bacterium]